MKRTKEQIGIVERVMILSAAGCCITWLAAWVTLIFNVKLGASFFVLALSFFLLYLLVAMVWSIYLNILRKKVLEVVSRICDYMKRKSGVDGTFKLNMVCGQLICVSFYTPNLDVINKNEIRTIVENNIPKDFYMIYEEILQD